MSQQAMNPILALDFGRARIGAAISHELQLLAHPLETIPANKQAPLRSRKSSAQKNRSCRRRFPRRMNRQIGTAATGPSFVEELRAILACPVVTWD